MRALCLAAIFTFVGAATAQAAGFAIKEQSTDAMGAAYAGAAATDKDASYLFYNPASLSGVEDSDVSVNAIGILVGSSAHYPVALTSAGTPTGGIQTPSSYVSDALVPELGLRKRLSPRWAVGLAVSAPWGLITHYPSDWAGRYYAEYTKLTTINATPTISFELTPEIALGAGMQIEYAKAKLGEVLDVGTVGALFGLPGAIPGHDDAFAHLSAEDWSYGFTLGAIAHPTPNLALGLSYRSEIKHTFEGPLDFTLDSAGIGAVIRSATGLFRDTSAKADVPMPDIVSFGLRDTFLDRWTGLAEVDWTNWSLVHQLRIVSANPVQPADITTFNWHNTWFGSLGVEYQYDDFWTVRAGTAYDESPSDGATREPRIPDASRVWLAAGVSYHWNDATDLRLSFAHLFDVSGGVARFPTQLGNTFRGVLIGSTNSYVNVVGVQFVYRD